MEATDAVQVDARELRVKLTHYLRLAAEGMTILITSRDKVIAELKAPASKRPSPRRPGALKSKIKMAEDFDTLPDDILDAMETWEY